MDDDNDFRFSLLHGRITTEIRNSRPGLAKRFLELEHERSQIIDCSLNNQSTRNSTNIFDRSYIERKPNFKQIQSNFDSSLELPIFQQMVVDLKNRFFEKINLWNKAKAQLKASPSNDQHVEMPPTKNKPKSRETNKSMRLF